MAIFEEKMPSARICALFLFAVFLLSYPLWHLGNRELFWNEGEYAAAAMEQDSFPPRVTVHGQLDPQIQPLFPLLARAISEMGFSMEFSLRAVSVISLLALVLIIALTGWRAAGLQAGVAGAVVMLTTLISAEKAVEGYPQMLTALILYGGWLTWFNLALGRGNWNFAWLSAGLFGMLAFYNAGFTGLCYFLIPLLLQQRPLNVWTKLRYPGLAAAFCMIVFIILFWKAPQWDYPQTASVPASFPNFSGYFQQILAFPPDVIFRFLPWSLMLWAPFCAALIPLDPNPLFGKFLRILFYSLALLLWLNPDTRGRDILYLAPLIATMIGLNYWIVVRRYGMKFILLFRVSGWILLLLTLGGIIYVLLPSAFLTGMIPALQNLDYRHEPVQLLISCGELAGAFLLICTGLFFCRRKFPVWMIYGTLFTAMMLVFWAVVNPYRARDRQKSDLGNELRAALAAKDGFHVDDDSIIYKDAAISGLYPECHYMGGRIYTVDVSTDFSDPSETVYVISTGVPSSTGRIWTRLHDSTYKDKRLFLYKGVLRKDEYDDVTGYE